MTILWIVLGLLAVFLAVIAVRAAQFTPTADKAIAVEPIEADESMLCEHLQAMIQLKTIANSGDEKSFEDFRALLRRLYPAVHERCDVEVIGRNGLLIRWRGKQADSPTVLMAHYDVVPADESAWSEPPFSGVIKDGELWGRGTLDTKCTLMGAIEAAEALILEGFTPKRDVYLAFGGDEECMGDDAPAIVAELKKRGVKPALVLDEGGAIVDSVFPGVKESTALIGIAEKGSAFIDITAAGKAGHASAPPARQCAGTLARAITRLERHPMPFRLTEPVKALFDIMGRRSSFAYKLIFANLWCFSPLLSLICKLSGGELNALVRTTCAVTRLSGSDAYNVLPSECRASANVRVIYGETVASAVERMNRVINDKRVKISVALGSDPSPVSPASGEAWDKITRAIRETYPEASISPYLMMACSDSRHYCELCENVYRFSGMPLTKAQRGMIHGVDERIPLKLLPDTVRFYMRVVKQC